MSESESCRKRIKLDGHLPTEKSHVYNNRDFVSIIVIKQDEILLHNNADKELWWPPFTRVRLNEGWNEAISRVSLKVLRTSLPFKVVKLYRTWDSTYNFANHVIAAAVVPEDLQMDTLNAVYHWVSVSKLPDVTSNQSSALVDLVKGFQSDVNMFSLCERSRASLLVDAVSSQNPWENLVKAAQLDIADQEWLYFHFLEHSFPFLHMNKKMFAKLIKNWGFKSEDAPHLFRAFDVHGSKGLTFRDLLYGVAAMQMSTPHGGSCAELRCQYIFRFYDTKHEGRLSRGDFLELLSDVFIQRGDFIEEKELEKKASQEWNVFGSKNSDYLTLTEFLQAVGQLKFRGTSLLFRFGYSIAELRNPVSTPPPEMGGVASDSRQISLWDGKREFELATHSVKIKRGGIVTDVASLWDIRDALSSSSHAPVKSGRMGVERLQSVCTFDVNSRHNEMMRALRYFEKAFDNEADAEHNKDAFSWGKINRNSLAQWTIGICKELREVMALEPRLVQLTSPTYILGDLHGNYGDLMCFEKALWRLGPVLNPASLLFLGDYVDRGPHSLETVLYLFTQKLICPQKIYLLRGNHELRNIQRIFTFENECMEKFGLELGAEVWEAVNSAFDVMPVAALIDEKIFCAHGGIPLPDLLLDSLEASFAQIPKPLPNPQQQSALAWEVLWNDPLHELTPELEKNLKSRNGFVDNSGRGTAHVFSVEALEQFLTRFKLSHVIRAHEVQMSGFQVQLEGKLLTVFSSSRYCGGPNEAACVLAERGKLRAIRLDTSH